MSILIPRSVWKPQYANGFRVIGTSEWEAAGKETWLHHTVTTPPGPDATLEQDCAHMRYVESIGQNNFGGGISYTAVVMPSGRAFEGHSLDRQGSHTYQRNNRARAICLAGNYDSVVPNAKMLGTVALILREWGCELDGGHRDVYATACPGQYAYARISSINQAARSGVPIEGDDVSADDVWNYQVDVMHGDGTSHKAAAKDVLRFSELSEAITQGKVAEVLRMLATLDAKISRPAPVQLTAEDRAAIVADLAPAVADLLASRLRD
jgi:hypothetical protein